MFSRNYAYVSIETSLGKENQRVVKMAAAFTVEREPRQLLNTAFRSVIPAALLPRKAQRVNCYLEGHGHGIRWNGGFIMVGAAAGYLRARLAGYESILTKGRENVLLLASLLGDEFTVFNIEDGEDGDVPPPTTALTNRHNIMLCARGHPGQHCAVTKAFFYANWVWENPEDYVQGLP